MTETTIKYIDKPTSVDVINLPIDLIKDDLAPAIYELAEGPMGLCLSKRGPLMNVPEKTYGTLERRVDKVLTSYDNTPSSFGVLFSGDKGSGKTLTASRIANRCVQEKGMPVILINDTFHVGALVNFVEQLGEVVLMFDEFAKKYDRSNDEQGAMLGLFDGIQSSKRLILMTENEAYRINDFFMNRPGRIHYHFEYERLEEEIIREFCEEFNLPEDVVEAIVLRRESSYEFSFDVLQAIVREYVLFGGDVTELCNDLNIEKAHKFSQMELVVESVEYTDAKEGDAPLESAKASYRFPEPDSETIVNLNKVGAEKEKEEDDEYSWLSSSDCEDRVALDAKNIVHKTNNTYTFAVKGSKSGRDMIVKCRVEEKRHGYNKAAY